MLIMFSNIYIHTPFNSIHLYTPLYIPSLYTPPKTTHPPLFVGVIFVTFPVIFHFQHFGFKSTAFIPMLYKFVDRFKIISTTYTHQL